MKVETVDEGFHRHARRRYRDDREHGVLSGATDSGLDLKDTPSDGQEANVESTSAQTENKDVASTMGSLIKTVSDGSGVGSLMTGRTLRPQVVLTSSVA